MNKEKIIETLKKEWHIPYATKISTVIRSFSLTEKTIFFFFTIVFAISGILLLHQVSKLFLVEVPDYGGSLTEGIVGSPRFINPILASSDIDKDLTSLIYSGLLKIDTDGKLIPDLAESYVISNDGLVYTVILKDNIYFHDGIKLTADDVVFTVEKTQDPNLKSPREINWNGVNVEKINEKTISFTLKQPYSPFIQNLTLGILPQHIWKTASVEEFPFSQFNTNPIGSGPYKIDSISYTSSGLPSEYRLTAFNKYSFGEPYITDITIKSFQKEKDLNEALKNNEIESAHSISPKIISELKIKNEEIVLSPLPRIFGIFFNQNVAPVFINKEVREALNIATDKKAIVDSIIGGYGQIIENPVPLEKITETTNESITESERIEKAKNILIKSGWKQNESGIFEKKDKNNTSTLSFSISTGDAPELKETAYLIQNQWQKIGAEVEVKIFGLGDLNQNIIKPRKYDALLFGEIVGRDLDLYPFWHSSQRNTPGLNIALYTNIKADKILENIRSTTDEKEQKKYLDNFNKEIKNDIPAVFTYSPYFIYIIPNKVHNVNLGTLTSPSERFSNVSNWYIETNRVWGIFVK